MVDDGADADTEDEDTDDGVSSGDDDEGEVVEYAGAVAGSSARKVDLIIDLVYPHRACKGPAVNSKLLYIVQGSFSFAFISPLSCGMWSTCKLIFTPQLQITGIRTQVFKSPSLLFLITDDNSIFKVSI